MTAETSAATTEGTLPPPDGAEVEPKGAESAPAVTDTDEINREAKSGVGKRIDELTRNWRETERDRDYWREMAITTRPPEAPKPVETPTDKTLADFNYDEVAYRKHIVTVARTEAVQAAKEELKREREEGYASERDADFADREDKYLKDAPDYMEVTRSPRLTITESMAETIKDSEHGPAIAYHLGKNPALAAQIARLPALQQAREIGRIEAKLTAAPPPKVSEAPPPAPKIDAVDPVIEKDHDKMTDAEWLAWRNKQLARQRKRG